MNISQRLRTCAKHTGLDAVIELLQEAADEIDALQARAQATQAEVAGEQIHAAFKDAGQLLDPPPYHWVESFARAILALRPERVQMTEDQVWNNDALMSANGIAGFKMDALMRIVRAVESHHSITTKAKGEQ